MVKLKDNHWVDGYLRNEQVVRMAQGDGFKLAGGYVHRCDGPDREPLVVTWQKSFDLIYILAGHGEYIDKENHRFKIYPGVFFQRLPEIHAIHIFSREYTEMYLSISQEALQFLKAFQSSVLKAPKVVDFGLLREIPLRYEQLFRDLRDTPEPQLAGVALRILEFYIEILGDKTSAEMKLIENACLLITADPSNRSRLESIARKIGLGYSNFRRLFHEKMGISPGDYRIRKRIELACELLSSGLSQKQVAFKLGYPEVQGFSRQFHRFMGISPARFLKKIHHNSVLRKPLP
jgi:AraC family transcriptional regulator, arabinose operon regulatory protein